MAAFVRMQLMLLGLGSDDDTFKEKLPFLLRFRLVQDPFYMEVTRIDSHTEISHRIDLRHFEYERCGEDVC